MKKQTNVINIFDINKYNDICTALFNPNKLFDQDINGNNSIIIYDTYFANNEQIKYVFKKKQRLKKNTRDKSMNDNFFYTIENIGIEFAELKYIIQDSYINNIEENAFRRINGKKTFDYTKNYTHNIFGYGFPINIYCIRSNIENIENIGKEYQYKYDLW